MLKRKKSHINAINVSKFQLKKRLFAFFLILIVILFCYIKFLATPLLVRNVKTQFASFSNLSINSAISTVMEKPIEYSELIIIKRSETGDVLSIDANSIKINYLSRYLTKSVLDKFLSLTTKPIQIPLGSFSGITIFAGVGPKVSYKINPYGEVFCNFISSFESAGVNQTYHRLYFDISLNVCVVLPFKNLKQESSTKVLVCETVIVGKIPEVYLNSGSLTEMLNLVPQKFSSWQNYIIVS